MSTLQQVYNSNAELVFRAATAGIVDEKQECLVALLVNGRYVRTMVRKEFETVCTTTGKNEEKVKLFDILNFSSFTLSSTGTSDTCQDCHNVTVDLFSLP
ncbi:hypothetical protein CBL_04730 [Carabus blaptoides fortunei]